MPTNVREAAKAATADKLSAREAAAFLGISHSRVRALLLEGRIRGEKVGQGWIIYRSELERFAAKPRLNGRPPASR
jgi:excisionase family DNA binding protein